MRARLIWVLVLALGVGIGLAAPRLVWADSGGSASPGIQLVDYGYRYHHHRHGYYYRPPVVVPRYGYPRFYVNPYGRPGYYRYYHHYHHYHWDDGSVRIYGPRFRLYLGW